MQKQILVIEDERSIQRILQYDLTQSGFHVELASDGQMGLEMALAKNYDVILLDIMLPKLNGFEVCQQLREHHQSAYIVMLSARDDELDRVQGLDVGADDYMTKPFSSREVVSKVKAIIRRKDVLTKTQEQPIVKDSGLKLDVDKFEVSVNQTLINFTLKEFEVLEVLLNQKGKVVSRDVLLDKLWGFEYDGDTRIVDVHMFKIREKLKPYAIGIKTIRGVGYMLEDNVNV